MKRVLTLAMVLAVVGRETRLSLLRYDLSEKPAFTMLKNLLKGLVAV